MEQSMKVRKDACHCGNIIESGKKYCSQKCYQTRNLKFDPDLAYTSLPMSTKHYYGDMKWGYDGDWESDRNRQNENQIWDYHYEPPGRPALDFDEENTLAAEMIADLAAQYGLKLELLLSGGLDSIVMVDVFRQAGIDFTPVTWRFTNGKNEHDIKYARQYCEKYNLHQ